MKGKHLKEKPMYGEQKLIATLLLASVILFTTPRGDYIAPQELKTHNASAYFYASTEESTVQTEVIKPEVKKTVVEEKVVEQEMPSVSNDDIELLALVTMAEAEGESVEGKRLVIDTILNRVGHDRFPDTISGVIYQANQFTSMWNGRVNRCRVTDEVRQIVKEELQARTNDDVIFFRTSHYSTYGTPLFQVGNHYFSSY